MNLRKSIIMTVMVVVVIIAAGIWSSKSLASTSNEFDSQLNTIEYSVKEKNWSKASESMENFQGDWKKAIKTWSILLDHFEIDNIEASLSRVKKYIEEEESTEALAELAVLRLYIKHIPDNEVLNLKNIL